MHFFFLVHSFGESRVHLMHAKIDGIHVEMKIKHGISNITTEETEKNAKKPEHLHRIL